MAATAFLVAAYVAQVEPPMSHEARRAKLQDVAKTIQVNVEMVLVKVTVIDPEDPLDGSTKG